MVKLTLLPLPQGAATIRIEGHLGAASVPELEALLRSSGADAGLVTLDLRGLASLDRSARERLRSLRAAGCRLAGGSLYIARLLEEVEP